jgi:hypothetical protein
MSIINLIWAPLTLVFLVIAGINDGAIADSMLTILGILLILGFAHATAFSIVVMNRSKNTNVIQAIIELKELKEKGILSEEEFQVKTIELLKSNDSMLNA